MGLHTNTQRGKRVIVVLLNGDVILDRFIRRADNNRWIELERTGRVPRSQIKSLSVQKGVYDSKRLGRRKEKRHP